MTLGGWALSPSSNYKACLHLSSEMLAGDEGRPSQEVKEAVSEESWTFGIKDSVALLSPMHISLFSRDSLWLIYSCIYYSARLSNLPLVTHTSK